LALSLGTTLATLWRGILLFTNLGTAKAASSSPFLWAMTLCIGSLFGFIGGVLAFNHKVLSLLFLFTATVMTYLGYPQNHILAYAFATISVLTIIHLIMYRRSKYKERYGYSEEEYYNEEEEYSYNKADEKEDDEDEDDEQETASKAKYKMPQRRSSFSMPQRSDTLTIKSSPQRQRETKVCLSCGIDVQMSYKYCPLCGTELYAPPDSKVDVTSESVPEYASEYVPKDEQKDVQDISNDEFKNVLKDEAEDTAEEKKDETIKIIGFETDTQKHETKRRYRYRAAKEDEKNEETDIENAESNKNFFNDKSEGVEVVPVVRKTSSNEPNEIQESNDAPIKPVSVHSKKQRSMEVDSSYQSFGRYTQSRKRRKVSVFQRLLFVLLAVCLVGAVGSFIYKGINKGSPPSKIEPSVQRVLFDDTPEEIQAPLENMNISIDEPVLTVTANDTEKQTRTEKLPYMELMPAKQIITIGGSINLRENHTTNSQSITRIQANNTYTLLEQWKTDNVSSLPAADKNLTGTWYKIQVDNRNGWIYGQYAMPVDGRAASLPSGYTEALLNSFGSNIEGIEKNLGKPAKQTNRGDTIVLEYANLNITLRQNKVQSIQTTGKGHNLLNGLAVGMTFDEMSKILGAPNRFKDGVLSYLETSNHGIVIRRENDGRVRSINIGNI
jgi:hypothetical protein